jgi:hypothetical protein
MVTRKIFGRSTASNVAEGWQARATTIVRLTKIYIYCCDIMSEKCSDGIFSSEYAGVREEMFQV